MPRRIPSIFAGLLLLLVLAFAVKYLLPSAVERAARVAREDAIRAGFKLEPEELYPPLNADERVRASVLTNAAAFADTSALPLPDFEPMPQTQTAVSPSGWSAYPHWSRVSAILDARRAEMDEARKLVTDGREIRIAGQEADLSPWLRGTSLGGSTAMKRLCIAFAAQTALAIHVGDGDSAWSNLFALNVIAARYRPPPGVQAFYEQAEIMETAFGNTWESIQAYEWTESRLAELDALWRGINFMDRAEEMAAVTFAINLANNRSSRESGATARDLWQLMSAFVSSPLMSWKMVPNLGRMWLEYGHFHREGTWRTDLELLESLRTCTERIREARRHESWREIELLFPAPYSPDRRNGFGPVFLGRQIEFSPRPESAMIDRYGMLRGSDPFVFLVAAEAHRRILLAAIAVERARLRLGRLPETLAEAGNILPDYITGEPLRYRPESDGTYLIYSVGFNFGDESGTPGADLVWPRLTGFEPPSQPAVPDGNSR